MKFPIISTTAECLRWSRVGVRRYPQGTLPPPVHGRSAGSKSSQSRRPRWTGSKLWATLHLIADYYVIVSVQGDIILICFWNFFLDWSISIKIDCESHNNKCLFNVFNMTVPTSALQLKCSPTAKAEPKTENQCNQLYLNANFARFFFLYNLWISPIISIVPCYNSIKLENKHLKYKLDNADSCWQYFLVYVIWYYS